MTLYHAFLFVHIAAGSAGLLAGPLALAVPKGGAAHRRIGLVFYYAMLLVAASALVLAVVRHIPFLFAVGFFSGYLNLTGRLVLRRQQQGRPHYTGWPEWVLAGLLLLFSLYFLGYGGYLLWHAHYFGLVFLFFAQSSGRTLWQDYQLFRRRHLTPTTWLTMHITRMVGTCIAAYTAFFVVNSASRFSLLGWFLPALLGTPVIIYWTRRVRGQRQPAAGAPAATPALA